MILNKSELDTLKEAKANVTQGFIYNTIKLNNYTPKKRRLKGKDMIVVPTTMIVEGVLNGIFYGKEEMAVSTDSWNGMPVILNHPEDGFSANRTEIIENYGLGTLYNTSFSINEDGVGLLNSEVWFDPEELERIDPELHTRVLSGGIVEVSTGLRLNLQFVEASHKGVDFFFVSSNYKPDHLAILPNNIGACSCSDGCGLRQNEGNTQIVEISENLMYDIDETKKENNMANCNCPEKVAKLTALLSISEETALSFNESQIDELLTSLNNEEVKPEEANEEVTPPVTEEGAEEAPIEEVTEDTIEGEQEPKEEIATNSEEETKEEGAEEAPAEEVTEESKEEVQEEQTPKIESVEGLSEVVAENLVAEITEALSFMKDAKNTLAEGILSNANNQFTKEMLETKSMKELEAINALANSVVNYSMGSGAGIANNSVNEGKGKIEPLSTPKYVTKEK